VALSVAEERTARPTLPLVAEALLRPEEEQARLLGTNLDGLRQDGRQVALELRRLVHGDLAGCSMGRLLPGWTSRQEWSCWTSRVFMHRQPSVC